MQLLAGKFALVTGASAGIGWATAEHLADVGANLIISARRQEKLHQLAQALQAKGVRALPVVSDAGAIAQIDALVETALAFAGGKLDILVVNAGRGLAGGLLSSDRSQWEAMYQTNVLGAAHLLRQVAQSMVQRKQGDIVTLGSVAGHNMSPFSGFYGSTKWAIWSITEALRREICATGVRVTCVKPGIVTSEFQQVAGYNYDNFGKHVQRLGRLLDPADIARAITFVVTQPPHVHLSDVLIRPTGQDYP